MSFELDLDRDASLLGASTYDGIRSDALQRVLRLLVERPGEDEEPTSGYGLRPDRLNVLRRRLHSAILVNARRGDGKTTFLTNLLRLIEQGSGVYAAMIPDVARPDVCELYSLGIIDPTLIESKQNIVVMILDRIREAVDQRLATEPRRSGEHEDVRKELRKLAGGLTLLDGIGSEELYGRDWADPNYVLQQGLDRAQAVGGFERDFYSYVARACEFLKTDAFVLAIDDVDTSFDKGWPVLEALRKYLATDRLKVVLSGDLGLYNMLVRREQWRQVTPKFLDAERALPIKYQQTERLAQLIEELQDQYLVKIVPTERRVELRPLAELVAADAVTFRIRGMEVGARRHGRDLASSIVRATLGADQDAFASAVMRLPLRSAIRILQVDPASSSADSATAPLDVMRQVLSSVLLSRDIDPAALLDADVRRTMHSLTQWLTKHSRWNSGARFTAGTGDDDYDLVAIFVAAALVSRFERRPSAVLEFALRICIVREKVEREGLAQEVLQQLIAHLWPTALESPVRFVSRLAAWDFANKRASGSRRAEGYRLSGAFVPSGSIESWNIVFRKLYGMSHSDVAGYRTLNRAKFAGIMRGDDDAAKQELLETLPAPIRSFHAAFKGTSSSATYGEGQTSPHHVFANTLDTLRSGLRFGSSAVLMLGACRVAGGQSRDVGVFSVLRLIATVAELAALPVEGLTEAEMLSRMDNLLNEAELFRSFPAPESRTSSPTPADDTSDAEGDNEDDIDMPPHRESAKVNRRQEFTALMIRWMAREGAHRTVMSPQTISRIWTRFTYAFDGISSDLVEGKSQYLGVLVHRTVIAFLHAVGVEALRTTSRPIDTAAYRNPVSSSQPFSRLLTSIYSPDDGQDLLSVPEVALFDFIFTCPLWGYFLARSDGEISAPTRIDYTDRVITHYYGRINASWGVHAKDEAGAETKQVHGGSFLVAYANPRVARGTAQFTGLFSLLNTIPLQDVAGPRARTNVQLATIAGVPLSAPRRRARVVPSSETSS